VAIQVIDAAFNQAIADVRAAADELRQSRRQADRRISGFLGVGWRGQAAESFVTPWGDWVDGARRAEAGLVAMAELLAATRRDFRQEDQASQRALDAISARIIDRLG
jgi:WXG100 family type VII secretion target